MPKTCSIDNLPIELLRNIFIMLHDTQRARSAVLMVCRNWRWIGNSTPHLWTKINIAIDLELGPKLEENPFIWGDLAERAGSLLLDVTWNVPGRAPPSVCEQAFSHFISKAPFSRWKSLILRDVGQIGYTPELLRGNFQNLETLETFVTIYTHYPILGLIAKTATAGKLKKIVILEEWDISSDHERFPGIHDILSRISTLKCSSLPFQASELADIPKNIQRLELARFHFPSSTAPPSKPPNFLSITYLNIHRFDDLMASRAEFPNLLTLCIGEGMCMWVGPRTLTFPKLEKLIYGSCDSSYLKHIIAPTIQVIHFLRPFPTSTSARSSSSSSSPNPFYLLRHESYSMFPPTVIFDIPLNIEALVSVLILYRLVEHLTLSFRQPDPCWLFLKSGLASRSEEEKDSVASLEAPNRGAPDGPRFSLCPSLVSLRLNLGWKQTDTNYWDKFATEIVKTRKGGNLKRVQCVWNDGNEITVGSEA